MRAGRLRPAGLGHGGSCDGSRSRSRRRARAVPAVVTAAGRTRVTAAGRTGVTAGLPGPAAPGGTARARGGGTRRHRTGLAQHGAEPVRAGLGGGSRLDVRCACTWHGTGCGRTGSRGACADRGRAAHHATPSDPRMLLTYACVCAYGGTPP